MAVATRILQQLYLCILLFVLTCYPHDLACRHAAVFLQGFQAGSAFRPQAALPEAACHALAHGAVPTSNHIMLVPPTIRCYFVS